MTWNFRDVLDVLPTSLLRDTPAIIQADRTDVRSQARASLAGHKSSKHALMRSVPPGVSSQQPNCTTIMDSRGTTWD